jgi:hypothetical protein
LHVNRPQLRFDHFKVPVQVIFGDLAGLVRGGEQRPIECG